MSSAAELLLSSVQWANLICEVLKPFWIIAIRRVFDLGLKIVRVGVKLQRGMRPHAVQSAEATPIELRHCSPSNENLASKICN
jgi:hypothetical protein